MGVPKNSKNTYQIDQQKVTGKNFIFEKVRAIKPTNSLKIELLKWYFAKRKSRFFELLP